MHFLKPEEMGNSSVQPGSSALVIASLRLIRFQGHRADCTLDKRSWIIYGEKEGKRNSKYKFF